MRQLYTLLLTFLITAFISTSSLAQTNGSIKGIVKTSDGLPAYMVNVDLMEASKGTVTAEDGSFAITEVPYGDYTLKCSYVGLLSQEMKLTVQAGIATEASFVLSQSAAQLSEVVVIANRNPNRTPVSIGKIQAKPFDLPQSMSVVTSRTITDQQATRLSDVIKNANGVSLGTTRGGVAETFFARGYSLGANNILKNGSRVCSGAIPDASTLESVEILKGSAALLYGNVSGGAVINMITKQPKFRYGGEASLRAGSYGFFKPIADVYGPISKKLAFRAIGSYESANSYRDQVKSDRYYINPSLLYKLNPKTEILVQGDYLNSDNTPDFGIGSLDGRIPNQLPRSQFFNTPWAYNKTNQTTASVNVNHQVNNFWRVNFIGAYQLYNRNYFSTERIQALANGNWGRNLTRTQTSEAYQNGQINLNGTFKTFNKEHNLLVGSDAERYYNVSNAFNLKTSYDTINILDASRFIPRTDLPDASIRNRTRTPTYRYGIYVQDLVSLSQKIKLLAGIRWSYQKIAIAKVFDMATERTANSPTAITKYDKAYSPRLGLVYQPLKTTSFFVSYSNNFTPNTGRDVYGQNLNASIIDQYEAGVKNDFLKDRISLNFTVYRVKNNNLAQQAQFQQDGTTPNLDVNVKELTGETTSDGAEVDITANLFTGLYVLSGYSYNYMRYTKTSGLKGSYVKGERLVNNAAHTANTTVFYTLQNTLLKGLKFGASVFYTGQRNAGWNNTVGQSQIGSRLIPIKGFTTFDLSAGYTFKRISIITKISNAGNTLNYYVHENYSVNPIAPRQFVSTLSYRF